MLLSRDILSYIKSIAESTRLSSSYIVNDKELTKGGLNSIIDANMALIIDLCFLLQEKMPKNLEQSNGNR